MGSMKKLLVTLVAVALLICLAIGGNRIYEDLPSTRYQQAVSLVQENSPIPTIGTTVGNKKKTLSEDKVFFCYDR